MLPIQDSRILYDGAKYSAICACGKRVGFSKKNSCLNMLHRKSCRHCKTHYTKIICDVPIYKRFDGKWCSKCSGCQIEQAYTRKDHAKQSEMSDWQCKSCVAKAKGYSENKPVGDAHRLYNRFRKSANSRQIPWDISFNDFMACFSGKCELTGWEISMKCANVTASLDRIDSAQPYQISNIQWVHTMVNMCKNKYKESKFISMCIAVANTKKVVTLCK